LVTEGSGVFVAEGIDVGVLVKVPLGVGLLGCGVGGRRVLVEVGSGVLVAEGRIG
jgi:hypothetical protein